MGTVTLALGVVGLALLLWGGDLLVRGAAELARRLGVPPLIVGLTVVGFGTSSPELAVSVVSAMAGRGEVTVGNVLGSNIFNVLFVLGLAALVAALSVSPQLVKVDVPFLIGASVLAWGLAADGRLSRLDGLVLLAVLAVYVVVLVRAATRRQGEAAAAAGAEGERAGTGRQVFQLVAGLGMLLVGSRWVVEAAVALARAVGLSELVIGLTVVAVGTSLPEVASSLVAALKGEREIAVGNVVGSNIYNLLGVLGSAAAVAPAALPIPAIARAVDIPVMVGVAVACLPIFFTGHRIDRWEGAVFLVYGAVYTAFRLLEATSPPAARALGTLTVGFFVPLTAVTLLALVCRAARTKRAGRG